jgi:hypothetical protein
MELAGRRIAGLERALDPLRDCSFAHPGSRNAANFEVDRHAHPSNLIKPAPGRFRRTAWCWIIKNRDVAVQAGWRR